MADAAAFRTTPPIDGLSCCLVSFGTDDRVELFQLTSRSGANSRSERERERESILLNHCRCRSKSPRTDVDRPPSTTKKD